MTKVCKTCTTRHGMDSQFCDHGHVLYEEAGDDTLLGRELESRYRVASRLGGGGFGVVYLAEQIRLGGRPCVVKVARPEFTKDTEFTARFKREQKAMMALRSRNTVQILDYGRTEDDVNYIVMEYIEGAGLDQIIKRSGRLVPRRALTVAIDVCNSLEEAHSVGILHRDLKPSNVMLLEMGSSELAKVIDFGIARLVGVSQTESTFQTATGRMPGTPIYASFEQLTGKVGKVSERSDIYSLGAMLYQMLSGMVPYSDRLDPRDFDSTTLYFIALAQAKASGTPTSILEVAPTVRLEKALDRYVLQMLETEPAMRPNSVAEVRKTLEAFLPGSGSQAHAAMSAQTTPAVPEDNGTDPLADTLDTPAESRVARETDPFAPTMEAGLSTVEPDRVSGETPFGPGKAGKSTGTEAYDPTLESGTAVQVAAAVDSGSRAAPAVEGTVVASGRLPMILGAGGVGVVLLGLVSAWLVGAFSPEPESGRRPLPVVVEDVVAERGADASPSEGEVKTNADASGHGQADEDASEHGHGQASGAASASANGDGGGEGIAKDIVAGAEEITVEDASAWLGFRPQPSENEARAKAEEEARTRVKVREEEKKAEAKRKAEVEAKRKAEVEAKKKAEEGAKNNASVAAEPSEAGYNAKYYAVSLTPDEVDADTRTDVAVVITPASGYKWNDEYPAKFGVVALGDVTVGKTEFSQKKKEVEIGKTEARLVLPVTVSGAGRHKLQVKANFSVCNDTSCKIMRKELFKLSISGK